MTDIDENLRNRLSMRRYSDGLFSLWYRLATPTQAADGASFIQREAARRGRFTSIVLFFFILALIILLPTGLFSSNPASIFAIGGGLLIALIALHFNRLGSPNVAGILITSYVFASVVTIILTSPNGLSTETLGLFYTLIFVEVLAVSLLPADFVLFVALINVVFTVVDLSIQTKTPEFALVMSASFIPIVTRLVALHVFVVAVLWLWVRSATQAIRRADQAEELAASERQIQELQQAELRQKEELERGVEAILQTHIQIANGNFQARAPLAQDNQLWRIAHSLNILIGRIQYHNQMENELKRCREMIRQLNEEMQAMKRKQNGV